MKPSKVQIVSVLFHLIKTLVSYFVEKYSRLLLFIRRIWKINLKYILLLEIFHISIQLTYESVFELYQLDHASSVCFFGCFCQSPNYVCLQSCKKKCQLEKGETISKVNGLAFLSNSFILMNFRTFFWAPAF